MVKLQSKVDRAESESEVYKLQRSHAMTVDEYYGTWEPESAEQVVWKLQRSHAVDTDQY